MLSTKMLSLPSAEEIDALSRKFHDESREIATTKQLITLIKQDTPEANLETRIYIRQAIDDAINGNDILLTEICYIFDKYNLRDLLQAHLKEISIDYIYAAIPQPADHTLLALKDRILYINNQETVSAEKMPGRLKDLATQVSVEKIFSRARELYNYHDDETAIYIYINTLKHLKEPQIIHPLDIDDLVESVKCNNKTTFIGVITQSIQDVILEETNINQQPCLAIINTQSQKYKNLVIQERLIAIHHQHSSTMSKAKINFLENYATQLYDYWYVDTSKLQSDLNKNPRLLNNLDLSNTILANINLSKAKLKNTDLTNSLVIHCTLSEKTAENLLKYTFKETFKKEKKRARNNPELSLVSLKSTICKHPELLCNEIFINTIKNISKNESTFINSSLYATLNEILQVTPEVLLNKVLTEIIEKKFTPIINKFLALSKSSVYIQSATPDMAMVEIFYTLIKNAPPKYLDHPLFWTTKIEKVMSALIEYIEGRGIIFSDSDELYALFQNFDALLSIIKKTDPDHIFNDAFQKFIIDILAIESGSNNYKTLLNLIVSNEPNITLIDLRRKLENSLRSNSHYQDYQKLLQLLGPN
jgi:hypothetical protein